jgi:hypothetical protein
MNWPRQHTPPSHDRFETAGSVQEFAHQNESPTTTLSVARLLANPAIASVILGASRVEQLMDMLAAADYKLNDELEIKLDEGSLEFRRGRRNEIASPTDPQNSTRERHRPVGSCVINRPRGCSVSSVS